MVEPRGLEPLTPCLQSRSATIAPRPQIVSIRGDAQLGPLCVLHFYTNRNIQYRILPYLNGNHTFTTPMVAMAVTTGLEPAISSVTDWRALQLLHVTISNQWEEISSSLPFSGMAAVIALIDLTNASI